jgi:O-succinylbenzoate synthase
MVGGIDYESFAISLQSEKQNKNGIIGVGWGDRATASETNRLTERFGVILSIISSDGSAVGLGEVSPLPGLHLESLDEVKIQINEIKSRLENVDQASLPEIKAEKILALNGGLSDYIDKFFRILDIDEVSPSLRSGIEMALISLSSQTIGMPILQALVEFSPEKNITSGTPKTELPLSGFVMRGRSSRLFASRNSADDIVYPSLKVKVGHQTAKADVISMSNALQETEGGKIRADANRGWDEATAIHFAATLEGNDVDVVDRLEFIEEPLMKVRGEWNFVAQIQALERWHKHSGVPYAVDESLADLADQTGNNFDSMRSILKKTFSGASGCAALILKPALLGLELSTRLARLAHTELGIGAVFSSSFDSGLGLGHTAFLAASTDQCTSSLSARPRFSHGLGTFRMLVGDTLSPPFGSYVTNQGKLKVSSLSRAFFGLGLDDMRESTELSEVTSSVIQKSDAESPDYRASAATSSSGREISVAVSMPLPFSDGIACSRFSDLPQQSRWSPWLSSVAYVDAGRETEWTLNVRGVRFSWRAVSSILDKPYRGITWESISGLKNMGVVEFFPTGADSCTMKVRMTIITPRIVATLFPGASVFAEDFLQDKLLRWSLEMFRDVVKGDLALERGDVELGDALFGAVEGRALALEATLSPLRPSETPANKDK